jgi:hypothetical protein
MDSLGPLPRSGWPSHNLDARSSAEAPGGTDFLPRAWERQPPSGGGGLRGSADRVLPAMQRLIDGGYVRPSAEAMALECERSQAHRARVTGEAVAGRVDAVVARGKAQSRG